MSIIIRAKQVCDDLANGVTLLRSGVFQWQLYAQANTDIPANPILAALHYCRHGRNEQRATNQDAFGEWLIPHLLDGKVTASEVRRLLADVEGAEDPAKSQGEIRLFSEAKELSFSKFLYHDHLCGGEYDSAYACLSQVPMEAAFLPYYWFSRHFMKMDELGPALDWVSHVLEGDGKLSLEHLIAAREIAAALGYAGVDRVQFHQDLLQTFTRWQAPNMQIRMWALWQIGFPVISDGSELAERVMAALPEDLRKQIAPEVFTPPASASGYEALLNLTTLNALSQTQYALPAGAGADEVTELDQVKNSAYRLRVLIAGYWRHADTQPLHRSFLNAFLAAKARFERQFDFVYPVTATQIFDQRRSGIQATPTLSYHTLTSPEQRFLNFKESALPGYFKFDREGFSGWEQVRESDLAPSATPEEIERVYRNLYATYVEGRRTKYPQENADEAPLPDRFILVTLQVPDDTVMSLAEVETSAWLEALVNRSRETGTSLVIKAHPMDKSTVTQRRLEALKASGACVFVSQAPIHDLLEAADVLVTVNSGVGIEALLNMTPVITLGKSEYLAVSWPAATLEELEAALDAISSGAADAGWQRRVKAFLYSYTQVRSFTLDHFPQAFDDMVAALKTGN